MGPEARLTISWGIVVISILYGAVVIFFHDVAVNIALWYVPVVLTLILITNFWKRHE